MSSRHCACKQLSRLALCVNILSIYGTLFCSALVQLIFFLQKLEICSLEKLLTKYKRYIFISYSMTRQTLFYIYNFYWVLKWRLKNWCWEQQAETRIFCIKKKIPKNFILTFHSLILRIRLQKILICII